MSCAHKVSAGARVWAPCRTSHLQDQPRSAIRYPSLCSTGAPCRVHRQASLGPRGKLSIKGRTLRKQGQVWIVVTADPLPRTHFRFNEHDVIFQTVASKPSASRPIIAGARVSLVAQDKERSQDVLQLHDPWARAKGSQAVQTTIPPDLDRTIQNQSKQMQKQQSDFAALHAEGPATAASPRSDLPATAKGLASHAHELRTDAPHIPRSGRCCEPLQSLDPSPHPSVSLMRTRTCRIESSSAAARGPLATSVRSSDVTVSRSQGHGLPTDHAGDAADALGKKKLQNHKNRITYAINSFAKDVATKGKISQCILTMQVVLLLCCQQRGEIACQPGTSTLCGVPPLEDCLITNHLQGEVDSSALGSNIGLQYHQIQKPQNEPFGTPFEKITSIRIVTWHPVRSHTCQVMRSGHDHGAVQTIYPGLWTLCPTEIRPSLVHHAHRSWTITFGPILPLSGRLR